MQDKLVGGISLERWKKAFAEGLKQAIDKDYFSDILFYNLYPNTDKEAEKYEDDDDAFNAIYDSKWDYVDQAFKEIFGFSRFDNIGEI